MSVAFRQYPSAPQLSWCVQYFWTLSGDASYGEMHPIFPDGSPELVFNFGAIVRERLVTQNTVRGHNASEDIDRENISRSGDATLHSQPRAMLVGQMTRPITIEPSGTLDILGVRLTPIGLSALMRAPASEFRGHTVSLDAVGATTFVALCESLRALNSDAKRIDALGVQLLRLMQHTGSKVSHSGESHMRALASTLSTSPRNTIDAWSKNMSCSTRTLERHFDRFVGLSPKEFARIRRFQSALALATEQPTLRWSMIAARTGYVDQSHMVRDFNQFAGASPSAVRPTLTEISETFVNDSALL